MKRQARRKLELRADTVRVLRPLELQRVAGGELATSEAGTDPWPCAGEYSWRCPTG